MFAYLFVLFHDNSRPSNILLDQIKLAREKLKTWEHDVNFGQVNITGSGPYKGKEYKDALRIDSFPAIRFYKKEFPYTYDGGKNADMMVSWIKRRIRGRSLPTIDFDTMQKLGENIQPRNTGGTIVFYGNLNSQSYKDYASAGKKYTDRDVVFGHTEYPEVLYGFNVTVPPIDEC